MTELSRFYAEAEFRVPLGLLRAEGYNLDVGHQIVEIDDEEVVVAKGDTGVLVCTGVLSKTYTWAARDALCVTQSAIAGLLGIARTEDIPLPFRLAIVHQDAFLEAATDIELLTERSAT